MSTAPGRPTTPTTSWTRLVLLVVGALLPALA